MTHVLAILASKGGTSKSSLATALAVRATKDGARVALLDADPQETLSMWWRRRGEPGNPQVYSLDNVASDVATLTKRDFDWVIVDGPPSNFDRLGSLVRVSDFVLIPVRVSAFDIDATTTVLDACKKGNRPYAFVLTQVDPRWEKFTDSAAKALKNRGPILAEQIRFRLAYASAPTIGKTGPESTDAKQAADAGREIDALWLALNKRMGITLAKVKP
jgi:chromosome partitioning protein